MVLIKTQRCPGTATQHHHGPTYQQQSYSTYQETGGRIQDGGYTNFSNNLTGPTTPYLNYSQVSSYSSENSQHHQFGGGYHGNGATATHSTTGGVVASGHETSYHENSHSHGHNTHGNGPTYGYQKQSWTLKNLDD